MERDDDGYSEEESKKVPVKSGGKPKTAQTDAMNYFMKKAGKNVEESEDDDDDFSNDAEDAEIPVVENSQSSVGIGAGLVPAKP